MPQTVQGVIARAKGEPVEVVDIVIPDPGPGEAVVAVQACGVCHTDLHYREGGINNDYPFLLGHEAAGIVEAVGPRGGPGRLRHPQLAGRVRSVPGLPQGEAAVLLRYPQRHATDDAHRRYAPGPGPRDRRFRREDPGRRRAVHQGRGLGPRGGGAAWLRCDGGIRCRGQHRWRHARGHRCGHRLRWRGQCGGCRCPGGRRAHHHCGRCR